MLQGRLCLQHVADLVLTMKYRHVDALFLVARNFNQWDIGGSLAEFSDIEEVFTTAAREGREIDRIFIYWPEHIKDGGCIPPLHTEDSGGGVTESNHHVQYFTYQCSKERASQMEIPNPQAALSSRGGSRGGCLPRGYWVA